MGYLLLTLLMILFCYTKMQNPESMIWGRFHIVMMTLALWLVYRLIPCRFTHLCRILAQMFLLGWWYPDTYQLNLAFPNLDHVFASYEQQLFGCQPALLFSQASSFLLTCKVETAYKMIIDILIILIDLSCFITYLYYLLVLFCIKKKLDIGMNHINIH